MSIFQNEIFAAYSYFIHLLTRLQKNKHYCKFIYSVTIFGIFKFIFTWDRTFNYRTKLLCSPNNVPAITIITRINYRDHEFQMSIHKLELFKNKLK